MLDLQCIKLNHCKKVKWFTSADRRAAEARGADVLQSGKSGVDTKNRALYYYNAKRISRRWPHAVFCYLLSLLTDNTFVLCKDVRPDDVRTIKDSGRKDFIIRLSEGLTQDGSKASGRWVSAKGDNAWEVRNTKTHPATPARTARTKQSWAVSHL